jgi:hypothetical protein
MTEIATNRDLYSFIAALLQQRATARVTLQAYLENLQSHGRTVAEREALAPSDFAALLQAAFDEPPAAREPSANPSAGFLDWERRIARQIRDLAEMKAAKTLDREDRYFGVDAPGGGRWYNFDPRSFLECAAAGTFGGWEEGDDTGRRYVPGPVTVLDGSGSVTVADPRDLDDPVVALPPITWEMFIDFLDAGQMYE